MKKEDMPVTRERDLEKNKSGRLEGEIRALRYQLQLELFQNHLEIWRKNQQLASERRRYASLFNFSPVCFMALDENANIVESNIACALLLVTPSRDLVGGSFSRFVWPPDWENLCAYRKKARIDQRDSFEVELRSALGRRFAARIDSRLTRDLKWLIAIADVSGYKDTQSELMLARDELEALCETLRKERDQRFQAEEELRKFTRKLIDAQERERQRIARELHDQVGQLMTYLGLLLDKAKLQLSPGLYRDAKSVAQEVLTQIRDLSSDLQPSMLRSVGLLPSLQALFDRFKSVTGIWIEFNCDLQEGEATGDAGLVAYRIVQEALTNVARHAHVRSATVTLNGGEGKILIHVKDQGKGFDSGSRIDCTGLTGMKERAQAIGGRLSVESVPGQGTSVVAELPLAVGMTARKVIND